MSWPFQRTAQTFLGVDIGTFNIRIVEVSRYGEQKKLENYAELGLASVYQRSAEAAWRGIRLLSPRDLAEIIKLMREEAQVRAVESVFSLPDFATFFTSFTLPPMNAKEVPQAVHFEARRHVPLPLSEVTLDWSVIGGKTGQEKEELKILLVVVSNDIVSQYEKIGQLAQLRVSALEAEAFSLKRALIKQRNNKVIGLIDIGAQSTTCNIVDRETLIVSHSFDMAGSNLTTRIARSLNIDWQTAEILKKNQGLRSGEGNIRKILLPLVDLILVEVGKVTRNFYQIEGREVEEYLLAGASAKLLGLKEYFAENLNKKVEIADPFAEMVYPPILEKDLKELAPGFAIAVGAALRKIE